MRYILLLMMLVSFPYGTAQAGKYNPVLSIGDPAPVWKDLQGVDDKKHSLADLKDKDVVVVVFTCNSCPYAVDYEDRLIALHNELDPARVALVAVNVNKVEEDLLPAMKKRAESKGFKFPYLFDETQQIARDYGATYTPEFVVLNKDRQVSYLGAMDDNTDASKVDRRHVAEAVAAVLDGKTPAVKETVAIGCRIRFERVRRRRK